MGITETMKVKVIDAICGAGKTSWAIQKINSDLDTKGFKRDRIRKFIYVTPFIKETERINKATNECLKVPNEKYGKGKKLNHVEALIKEEKSIVMTHELFSRIDNNTFKVIEEIGYILIMDEVPNVINQVQLSSDDINLLIDSNIISVDNDNKVKWEYVNYSSSEKNKFGELKKIIETNSLYYYKSEKENKDLLFQIFNSRAFSCFKEVFLLTYLFDGQLQKCYFDFLDIEYNKFSVKKENEEYKLIDYDRNLDNREQIKRLLNVYEDQSSKTNKSKLNSNFFLEGKTDGLTSNWFDKTINVSGETGVAREEILRQLNRNTINYFKNRANLKKDEIFWTTIKSVASEISKANPYCKFEEINGKIEKSKKNNFLPMNIRATNDYRECKGAAYIYNRYANPLIKNFFNKKGIQLNEELLAVSDLVQFIFRGTIRDGYEMSCYIPSTRMRDLLNKWMDYKI